MNNKKLLAEETQGIYVMKKKGAQREDCISLMMELSKALGGGIARCSGVRKKEKRGG